MSMGIDKELAARTLSAKTELNNNGRHFIVSDRVIGSYTKKYKFLEHDIKLLRFANDSIGTMSDAFILYAVAMMGVCDRISIQNFLNGLKRLHPELSISNPNDTDAVRARLRTLTDNGFLFRHLYKVDIVSQQTGKPVEEDVLLYTLDKSSQSFMNQKLGFHTKINEYIQAKPLEELIGWASTAYAASAASADYAFNDFEQGIFRCKSLGTVMMPMELKMIKDGQTYYVSHIPAFLYRNKSRQTDERFKADCYFKIDLMKNYLAYRGKKDQSPYIVVAAESIQDMERMKDLIVDTEVLLDFTERIYFTGEGLIKKTADIRDAFLQMKKTEKGYELVSSQPVYMIGTN